MDIAMEISYSPGLAGPNSRETVVDYRGLGNPKGLNYFFRLYSMKFTICLWLPINNRPITIFAADKTEYDILGWVCP